MFPKAAFILFFCLAGLSPPASAGALEPVEIPADIKAEIVNDLTQNFSERLQATSSSDSLVTDTQDASPAISARDQRVMLKALYAGVQAPLALAGIQIDEDGFNRYMARILLASAKFGVLPSAITFGYYGRIQLGIGATEGAEFNFYLEQGKLKVSSYDLKAINFGIEAMAKVGFYLALCFGSCTGGDVNGTYLGMDADVIFGAGASVFVEAGIDTTDLLKSRKTGDKYTLADLYNTKAFYIGTGMDVGIGMGASGMFQNYHMTSDVVIADLYSILEEPHFNEKMKFAFNRANLFRSVPLLH